MTPVEFKEARQKLGLSVRDLGQILDTAPRTIERWEAVNGSNSRDPNPIASRVLKWMLDGYRPPQWPK